MSVGEGGYAHSAGQQLDRNRPLRSGAASVRPQLHPPTAHPLGGSAPPHPAGQPQRVGPIALVPRRTRMIHPLLMMALGLAAILFVWVVLGWMHG